MYSDATQKTLQAGHAKGKFITKENAVQGVGIPFHPGAEKFYKEVGPAEVRPRAARHGQGRLALPFLFASEETP